MGEIDGTWISVFNQIQKFIVEGYQNAQGDIATL